VGVGVSVGVGVTVGEGVGLGVGLGESLCFFGGGLKISGSLKYG